MKFILTVFLCILLCIPVSARTRRALTVFIGDYPQESGWKSINAYNDSKLILDMLHDSGFKDEDIVVLRDAEATYEAIIKAFRMLSSKASAGDVIYIHFSCHGQQITDVSGDESDGWDESLIPYDALFSYGQEGYRGEKHLVDDELNSYLALLSQKVTSSGLVLCASDACHSGDNDRNTEEAEDSIIVRGVFDRFELPVPKKSYIGPLHTEDWVSISACKEYQNNYEVTVDGINYGRLSYAISRTFKISKTIEELIRAIKEDYSQLPSPKGYPRQQVTYRIPKGLESVSIR